MIRLSITARLALLAVVLALVPAFSVAALIWQQTHDDAIGVLRRDTIEQANGLVAVYRSGGLPALRQAIEAEQQSDDETLVAEVMDHEGNRKLGVGPGRLAVPLESQPFVIGTLGTDGDWANGEAGFAIHRIGTDWLVSGRLLDDWERAQRTIERALLLALVLAAALGLIAGLVLTRYVTRRLERIAGVVDAVAAGDLGRRVGADAGGGDAFDRLARQIDGMLDRIDRLMGELRIMTDSIAHDLRSPLARLRARTEQALVASDPAQRETALQGLLAETDLVMRMLGTLLEISRTESARREAFADYSPAQLVQELAELYAPVAEEAGMALTVSIEGEPKPIPMHRELLSQALANLVDNAMRHAGEGGRIALSVAPGQGGYRLTVADRGPGIPAEAREQALRRFGRLDEARSRPGAGLGLTLVESVARLHDGALELADASPGLAATIFLPAHR